MGFGVWGWKLGVGVRGFSRGKGLGLVLVVWGLGLQVGGLGLEVWGLGVNFEGLMCGV